MSDVTGSPVEPNAVGEKNTCGKSCIYLALVETAFVEAPVEAVLNGIRIKKSK